MRSPTYWLWFNKYFREGPVHCMEIKSGIREPLFSKEEFEAAQEWGRELIKNRHKTGYREGSH